MAFARAPQERVTAKCASQLLIPVRPLGNSPASPLLLAETGCQESPNPRLLRNSPVTGPKTVKNSYPPGPPVSVPAVRSAGGLIVRAASLTAVLVASSVAWAAPMSISPEQA